MAVQCYRVTAQGGYISAVELDLETVPNSGYSAKRRGPAEFDVCIESGESVSVSMKGRTAVVVPITPEQYEAP